MGWVCPSLSASPRVCSSDFSWCFWAQAWSASATSHSRNETSLMLVGWWLVGWLVGLSVSCWINRPPPCCLVGWWLAAWYRHASACHSWEPIPFVRSVHTDLISHVSIPSSQILVPCDCCHVQPPGKTSILQFAKTSQG